MSKIAAVIRPINKHSDAEILLVARRMRQTLVEVLGAERGTALYTMDWLEQRVRWHLDAGQSTACVYLAEAADGEISGHTIVRKDLDSSQQEVGLFSTTYVATPFRRAGVASQLLKAGEDWIRGIGLLVAETYTDKDNHKLIQLFSGHGYQISPTENEMVILRKGLADKGP